MNRRYIIILIIVAVLFGGALWYLSSMDTGTTGSGTSPSKGGGLSSLFPSFGSNAAQPDETAAPAEAGSDTESGTAPIETVPDVISRISAREVAGMIALPPETTIAPVTVSHSAKDVASTSTAVVTPSALPIVRFTERGTGFVYDIRADGTAERKISGTTVPRAAIAQFGDGGKSVAIRYVKSDNASVGTFLGSLIAPVDSVSSGTLRGTFLSDNVLDLAVSPDGKSIAYVTAAGQGSVGMTMKTDGTGKKQLFQNPLAEWLLDWKPGAITVTSKAASDIPGYAYKVSGTGEFSRFIGGIAGLTTNVSPDGKSILYGIGQGGTMELRLRRLKDGKDIALGLRTLPEKCVWSQDSLAAYCGVPQIIPSGDYPDAWYQGIVSFTDGIWKIGATDGLTTRLTKGSEGLIDSTYPTLSKDGKYLFLINKTDDSLWALDLNKAKAF